MKWTFPACIAASGIIAAFLATGSLSVRAQSAPDTVLRSWSCLAGSIAAGSPLANVAAAGCAPAPIEWPRTGIRRQAINPPSAPSGLEATVLGHTVSFKWSPGRSGGTPTSFVLQAGSASGWSNVVNANTGSALPTLTATEVPAGKYFFRVLAQSASGTSGASNEVAVTVVAGACTGVPGAPTSLSSSVSGSDVALSWQPPAGECQASSYMVEAGSSSGQVNLANFSTGGASPGFAAGGVPTGVYYVRVRAVNAAGASSPSNEIVVAVNTCGAPPGPVTNLAYSVFGQTVSLTWTAASGSPTGYFIAAGSSPGASDLALIGTGGGSFIGQGVPPGTYYVRVFARNACGAGPNSNEVVITVSGSGSVPTVTVTSMHSFSGAPTDGSNLSTLIQGRDGAFYGTTVTGGPFNSRCTTNLDGCGTVFSMTASGAITLLHTFGAGGCPGAEGCKPPIYPYARLVQASDGNFYGTTSEGTSVFRITPAGSLTHLTNLGGASYGSLIQATDGFFYGTTTTNGVGTCPERSTQCTPAAGQGTVFRMTSSGALTYLHVFTGGSDGSKPYAGLLQASDGNFYGTTNTGGSSGAGTIFRITSAGVITTVHTFTGAADGANPLFSALTQGSDGNLYGTSEFGGSTNVGTAFKMSLSGAFTVLHSFTGVPKVEGQPPSGAAQDGSEPVAGLFQASDGNYYGTTGGGGALGGGTAYMITPAGLYTQLFMFAGNAEGSSPTATFIQGSDGNLYSTAQYGGTLNKGAIFRMTLAR